MTRGVVPKERLGDRRGRPKEQYDPKKLFLVVTEGLTERNYLNALKAYIGPSVEIVCIEGSDSKRSLVEKAIRHREEREKEGEYDDSLDVTWVVLDRDADLRNKTDKDLFNQALNLAQNEGIQIAYSNDAFELWLLLHFIYLDTAQSRKDLKAKLKEHLGGRYKKSDPQIYDKVNINGSRDKAMRHASRLLREKAGIAPADANPSTRVHILVKDLLTQFNREETV